MKKVKDRWYVLVPAPYPKITTNINKILIKTNRPLRCIDRTNVPNIPLYVILARQNSSIEVLDVKEKYNKPIKCFKEKVNPAFGYLSLAKIYRFAIMAKGCTKRVYHARAPIITFSSITKFNSYEEAKLYFEME